MVVLRLGKINNEERKFIPTKKEYLERYLASMQLLEQYEILQTYKDGFKYRRYNHNGEFQYTRNNKMVKFTNIEQIDAHTFENVLEANQGKAIRKIRSYYIDGAYEIDVDRFEEPACFTMVEVSELNNKLSDYVPFKGFIEVSDNKLFQNKGIFDGSIKDTATILEGTDGVGKTTVIKELLKEGIICQDRCMEVFSRNMLFHIPMQQRAELYYKYLLANPSLRVIFLINKDKSELGRRILERSQYEQLSKFDAQAYEYGMLYEETYDYMQKKDLLLPNLKMVDCTGLSFKEQLEAVKKEIL